MSEAIEYTINVSNFKDKELEEFKALCSEFDEFEQTDYKDEHWFLFYSWRYGGHTCEEIIREHFDTWLDQHKHVKFTAYAKYVEQAPEENIYSCGGE